MKKTSKQLPRFENGVLHVNTAELRLTLYDVLDLLMTGHAKEVRVYKRMQCVAQISLPGDFKAISASDYLRKLGCKAK